MKFSIALLFSLFLLHSFGQGTTFVGIGVRLELDSTLIPKTTAAKIIAFSPDGSAIHSGLEVNDLILKVDGKSAVNISLDAVVKLIVGEEGTTVTLEVNRGYLSRTFTMQRRRIANAFAIKSASSSEFCTGLTTILSDAPYHFNNVIDTNSTEDNKGCRLTVPGADKIYFKTYTSTNCYMRFGKYTTETEAKTGMDKITAQIKTCFPNYYFFSHSNGKTNSIQIGMAVSANSYREALMELYYDYDSDLQKYVVMLRIDDGVPRTYFGIDALSTNSEFAKAVRKVYDDVAFDFSHIKGTEHVVDELFSISYWYDLNFAFPQAGNAFVDEGSIMPGSKHQCVAQFFLGGKEEAADTYKKFSQIVNDALGSEFIYSYDKPEEFITNVIPSNAENVMIFAIKRERSGEDIPVIALINQKQADGRYLIYLDFYSTTY